MELKDLVEQVEGFDSLPPREKIRLFAWHLHTNNGKEVFDNAAIRACYDDFILPTRTLPNTWPVWRSRSPQTL